MIAAEQKRAILKILNEVEKIEEGGGDFPYLLVKNDEEMKNKLKEFGVKEETLAQYGDEESFCVLAFAFNEGYANEFQQRKLLYQEDKYAVFNSRTKETKLFVFYNEAYEEYKNQIQTEKSTETTILLFETLNKAKKESEWHEEEYK